MKIYHDAQIEAQLKDAHERLDDDIENYIESTYVLSNWK